MANEYKHHSPIMNPPFSSPLQYTLFSAIATVFDYIATGLFLNLQQQNGAMEQKHE